MEDPALLGPALVHRSWCAENPGWRSNERLEFLGDSVLGIVITDHLFTTYPDLAEGDLAKVRASVVSAAALSEVADELALGEAMLLGKGEEVIYERAFGNRSLVPDKTALLASTVFDVASLTKPLATTLAIMYLVREKKIRLEDQVTRFIPTYGVFGKT